MSKDRCWLAVEFGTHGSSYLGNVSLIYEDTRFNVHSRTRTQYRLLQTPSSHPLRVLEWTSPL